MARNRPHPQPPKGERIPLEQRGYTWVGYDGDKIYTVRSGYSLPDDLVENGLIPTDEECKRLSEPGRAKLAELKAKQQMKEVERTAAPR